MNILVVSGFLGAGKTTFIKEMIRQTRRPIVVLENEYGETDLDSREISQSTGDGVQVMELIEGCVCCTRKDSFANSLIAIQASLSPEILVVEPTGVAKLGNILSNVQKVVWEQIRLLPPVVVIAPRSYAANMQEYRDICEDQIRHAAVVVFSKIENEAPEVIADVKRRVLDLNPNAAVIDTPYPAMGESWFNALTTEGEAPPAAESTESDRLEQLTLQDAAMTAPEQLILLLEALIHGRLGSVARAKGVVPCGGTWLRFNAADGLYQIAAVDPKDEPQAAQCVFIGAEVWREAILPFFSDWKGKGDESLRRMKAAKGSGLLFGM